MGVGNQNGYIALMAILVVGAASTAIAVVMLMTGVNSQRVALTDMRSDQARNLATACAEEALQELYDATTYTGTGSLTLGQGTCIYSVANTGGANRSITASGTVGTVVRKLSITATIGATTITINSWQDSTTSSLPAHVQSNGSLNAASANSIAQAFAGNVTAGSLIVVAVSWDTASTLGTITCTDTRGNSYTSTAVWNDATNTQAISVCYAPSAAAGATTVTATFGGNVTTRRIIVSEYSGIITASPVDIATGAGGSTATTATDAVTSGAAVTTSAGDLIYGVVMDTSGTTTINAGTSFTQRFSLNSKDFAVQDRVQSATGSIASIQSFATAHRYDAAMVTFKVAP